MVTISLPSEDVRDAVGAPPDGIEVVVWDGTGERPEQAERIAMFVGGSELPAASVLAGLPGLRVVQLLSAGVEPWLPLVPDGVVLCNGRGVHGPSTAELAVAGLLAVVRELPTFVHQQHDHDWTRRQTASIATSRVLLLGGPGDIGSRIGAALRALDASTTSVAHTAREGVHALDELDALLPAHDVVVVALPLTDETAGLFDAARLALMPDGAILVNIARGAVVHTAALLAELRAGRLRAFLDVTDPEPLPPGHPLWDAPGLLLTPHVGGGTKGWEVAAARLVREQAGRLRDGGELVNRVGAAY